MDISELVPLNSEKEITKQWLGKLLSEKFCSSVTPLSWQCVLPTVCEGFLSDIAYVRVRYKSECLEEAEIQLVFKFLPQLEERRKFMLDGGFAEREVKFYEITRNPEYQRICLKSGMVLPIPECYFATYAQDCATIVMNNLKAENHKTVIIKEGSTFAQTKVALKAIAFIHATGYIFLAHNADRKNLGEITKPLDTDVLDQFFIPNLKTLVEMYEGTPTAESFRALIPATKSIYSYQLKYPLLKTIIHGDFWAGQLLFSDDESNAIVIDWQFCNIGNPVGDIMSMFFMSSDIEVLDNHLEEVLKEYWFIFTNVLKANGTEAGITFEQLVDNVEELWVCGFIILACSIHDFIPGGNLTHERLRRAIKFLEDRGMFTKLIDDINCKHG